MFTRHRPVGGTAPLPVGRPRGAVRARRRTSGRRSPVGTRVDGPRHSAISVCQVVDAATPSAGRVWADWKDRTALPVAEP